MHKRFTFRSLLVFLAVCMFSGRALAATSVTWTFTQGASDITTPGSQINVSPYNAWGNTVQAAQTTGGNTYTATAQAWSSTGTPGNPSTTIAPGSMTAGIYTAVSNIANPLQSAYLGVYSGGLGVNNRETTIEQFGQAPQHAVSNEAGYDSVLFAFNTATSLTSVLLGYPGSGSNCTYSGSACDSDIVVMEWMGSGVPTMSGSTYGSAGWVLVGNTIGGAAKGSAVGITAVAPSQYWLIGTYIPVTGATKLDSAADFAKIAAVTGTVQPPGKAPEPGSALLSGLALGMLGIVRRLRRRT